MTQKKQAILNSDIVTTQSGGADILLVCEHASHHIPTALDGLGLSDDARLSHAAWDPGALAVSKRLATLLDASLVFSHISRLVYDCNRPPSAADAMPPRSEVFDIPGNANLDAQARDARTQAYYWPFHAALATCIAQIDQPIIITVHSFTPVYHGTPRQVEIGILHDSDTRLADAMLHLAADHTHTNVQRNAPYGPENGVTHTLTEHATKAGYLNVMLEIRNDLIATENQQNAMAETLSAWITAACDRLKHAKDAVC